MIFQNWNIIDKKSLWDSNQKLENKPKEHYFHHNEFDL